MNSTNHTTNTLSIKSIKPYKALQSSAAIWFMVAVGGQWLFAYYIAIFYGGNAIKGDFAAWTKRMIHGFIEGDYMGNAAVLLHILLAFIITFGGPLQFIPWVRNRYPAFHRVNGRAYILTAFLISLGGLYMIWSRSNEIGGLPGQISLTINALLIMSCASTSIRFAIKRKINSHQIWAMRTFLAVSGVWFFRVGFGFWILINGGAPGSNETLTGPFDISLYFGSYLLPLIIYEFYLYAKHRGKNRGKFAMAASLFILSVAMAGGIFMAAQIFWIPNL